MNKSPLPYSISFTPTDHDDDIVVPSLQFTLHEVEFEIFFRISDGNPAIDIYSAVDESGEPFSLDWDQDGREEALETLGQEVVDQVDLFFLQISLAA